MKNYRPISDVQFISKFLIDSYLVEIQNSRITKSSFETELRKMTSHFKL